MRERVAVAARIEGWFPAGGPDGSTPDGVREPARRPSHEPATGPESETGDPARVVRTLGAIAAGDGPAAELWLLPGARLRLAPEGGDAAAYDLVDAPIAGADLAERLRDALLDDHVAGWRLDGVTGAERQVALAEWLSLAWRADDASRAWLLDRLARAVRPEWVDEAARLKTAFERGLGDRHEPARRVAIRALVGMAAHGPLPPYLADHPERELEVVLAVPRADVRAEAYRALAGLPDADLARLAAVAEPAARADLVHASADVRAAAGALEARLAGAAPVAGSVSGTAADGLDRAAGREPGAGPGAEAASGLPPADRLGALRAFAARPGDHAALIPSVLEALADPDDDVRRAAVDACRALLSGSDPAASDRALAALLGSSVPDVVAAGADGLPADPAAWPERALSALRRALDGPEAARARVAERLADHAARGDIEATAEAFGRLLRHEDPVVRQVALRRLARAAADRAGVRDRLTHDLMARLHGDPVPEIRGEVAEALVAMRFPNAVGLAAQLAADPHPVARQRALAALRRAGDAEALRRAERTAAEVAILLEPPLHGDGDARIRWTRALEHVATEPNPRRLELLLGLLRAVPADSAAPFARFAEGELDRHILALAAGPDVPEGVASVCRRLMEPAHAAPLHAARLAGAVAARDERALDFLWALHAGAEGRASEAARRALAGIAGATKSERVRRWLVEAQRVETDPARRDVLRTLLSSGR